MDELIGSAPALNTHPDILIIDQGILLQELSLKEQKSRYLPQVNAFLSYAQQAQRNEFNFFESGGDWFPSTVIGVTLTLPIFSSGMRHQQVKQIEIDVKEIQLQRELAIDGLALATTQAKSNYLFAKENFQLEEGNMALAGRIRDKTRTKYQEGLASSFELNEIENQYLQAQGRKIQASMSLLSSLNELKKAYNRL
jgi:outer membrane protein TolC